MRNSRNVALVRARDPGWEVGRWVRRELQALLGAPAESLELLTAPNHSRHSLQLESSLDVDTP